MTVLSLTLNMNRLVSNVRWLRSKSPHALPDVNHRRSQMESNSFWRNVGLVLTPENRTLNQQRECGSKLLPPCPEANFLRSTFPSAAWKNTFVYVCVLFWWQMLVWMAGLRQEDDLSPLGILAQLDAAQDVQCIGITWMFEVSGKMQKSRRQSLGCVVTVETAALIHVNL